mgnify:CR=1 FL=1
MTEITLKQAQEQVDNWIKNVWRPLTSNELTNMTILTEEVANWLASWPAHTANNLSRKATNTVI